MDTIQYRVKKSPQAMKTTTLKDQRIDSRKDTVPAPSGEKKLHGAAGIDEFLKEFCLRSGGKLAPD